MSIRPSDRAIAAAFWEKFVAHGLMRDIRDRARELDATAAPVVVGEDEKNAARYRWLRSIDREPRENSLWVAMGTYNGGLSQWNESALDRLIDAHLRTAALAGD